MSNSVWAGTRVFVIDKDNRVLMVKHRYEVQGEIEEFWVIPGGGIREETGLDIKISGLLWTVEEWLYDEDNIVFRSKDWGSKNVRKRCIFRLN